LGGEEWEDIAVPSNIMNEHITSGQCFLSRNAASVSANSRDGMGSSLEESWSSLSFFDKRHKGRLTEKAESEYRLCFSR
jgi:hypothetical protein